MSPLAVLAVQPSLFPYFHVRNNEIYSLFKMFTPLLLFSKCLRHYHYFQNVYTITIFKMFTTLLFSFFPKS